jgi:dienelactone hydrolase
MSAESGATHEVSILVNGETIAVDVTVPARCRGVVVFAHGSGSSRLSTRNRAVAKALGRASFATVLADLLTPAEAEMDARTARPRFDIDLLGSRVVNVLDWVESAQALRGLPIGLFGASTGAAAALVAAAVRPAFVAAVVSRGGRPDLAGLSLPAVRAPTLLIVGGRDPQVLDLNRDALARLTCESRLEIVPGATHLFEESGTLEQVTVLARDWFERHLVSE